MDDLGEFAAVDSFEAFIPAFELLEGLHRRLRHTFVGLGRAADENELFTGGHAFVAVGVVEADTEQAGYSGGCGGFGGEGTRALAHGFTVLSSAGVSSDNSKSGGVAGFGAGSGAGGASRPGSSAGSSTASTWMSP